MDCTHLDAFDPAGEVLDVDDLLDFSITDDDIGGLIEAEEYCAPSSSSSTSSLSGLCRSTQASEKNSLSRAPEGDALCCPPDELAEFDWFSSFVAAKDDDIIPCSVEKAFIINKPGAAGDGGAKVDEDWSNERIVSYCFPEEAADMNDCSSTRKLGPLHHNQKEERVSFLRWEYKDRRARSKRARTGGRVWTLSGRLVGGSHSRVLSGIDYEEEEEEEEEVEDEEEEVKRMGRKKRPRGNQSKRRKARGAGERGRGRGRSEGDAEPPRACSHCLVTKTPQWRAGPAGPKSLCNACGVRFKSGRLLPEYRPAASPTFVSDLHSNSHKKVLEMRRSKEEESHPLPPLSISHSPSHSCLSNVS